MIPLVHVGVLPVSDSVFEMADSEGSGGSKSGSIGEEKESRERTEIPSGRVVPLNSRRLTATHLRQVAEALGLPTTGSTDQLRQLIEGKLESDKHVEAANVQVVLQEEQRVETKFFLMDENGVFLETTPLVLSKEGAESEKEALQEALEEVNQQNSELTSWQMLSKDWRRRRLRRPD